MRRGFTLLEVLLALGMLALVISLIQGAYSGAVRSRDYSRAATAETHAAAFVLHRIANELAMTYADPKRLDGTGLVVETDSDGVASLLFTSRVPPVAGFSAGGDAELAYFVETDTDGNLALWRRESDDLDGDLTAGGEEYVLLRDIRRFAVECYDPEQEQWLEEWDSADRPSPPALPQSVRITLGWREEDEENAPVYRTTTPVYAAEGPP